MKIRTYAHALIAFGIFVVALSLYAAWYAQVGKESAVAVSLADKINAKKESRTRTQEAKDELERALEDETAVKNYFVDTENVVPFLERLQDTGAQFGADVEVESVSAKTQKETGEPHDALELALRITGTFGAVERTLGAIEYQPYDTVITQLSLNTSAAGASSTPQWAATLTARVGTKVGGSAAEAPASATPPMAATSSVATSSSDTAPVATTSADSAVPEQATQ